MNKKILVMLFVAIFIMTSCKHNKPEKSTETKTENSSNELVLRDNQIVSGLEAWQDFLAKTQTNPDQSAEITIKKYNTYEGESTDVIESVLKYDGQEYAIGHDLGEERSYKYLIKRDGDAINDERTVYGYFLTNDKDVTYSELMFNIYASSSYEQIEHLPVFWVMDEKDEKDFTEWTELTKDGV